jgi:cytochrome c556
MIVRTVLAVAAFALGITAVVAQSDPIAARKAIMKENGAQSRIATEMIDGKRPFDLSAAKKVLATFESSATKAKPLFPENSRTGGDTKALPAIWEKKADFDAKLAKLGSDAKAAESKVKDLESFKNEVNEVRKNCGGCHNTYRQKAS